MPNHSRLWGSKDEAHREETSTEVSALSKLEDTPFPPRDKHFVVSYRIFTSVSQVFQRDFL